MIQEQQVKTEATTDSGSFVAGKLRDYMQLMKPRLSFLVVFSSVVGYLLAPGTFFSWSTFVALFLSGMLVTNGANIINQILERNSDKFMRRTMVRPLPGGRMGIKEAWTLSLLSAIAGVALMASYFNTLAATLSFVSLLLYGFAYTPMKKIHPIATLIGAIPGALPPLIGWVAATNSISDAGGWALFAIQFFWQFPHFWAIAWVSYEDYLKAGIRMLPSSMGKTSFTGLQCMFYSITLIPIGIVPYYLGVIGEIGMWMSVLCGIAYFIPSVVFYIKNDKTSAKRVMFASFIYLPIILIAFLADKI